MVKATSLTCWIPSLLARLAFCNISLPAVSCLFTTQFCKNWVHLYIYIYLFLVMFYSAPWLVLIKGLIMNNKLWKQDKSPKDIAESLTDLKKGISYSCLSYKLRCYTRISTPDKTGTTHVQKIRYFLTCVWYSQSNADTSLAFRATWSRWWVNSKAFAIFNPKSFVEIF